MVTQFQLIESLRNQLSKQIQLVDSLRNQLSGQFQLPDSLRNLLYGQFHLIDNFVIIRYKQWSIAMSVVQGISSKRRDTSMLGVYDMHDDVLIPSSPYRFRFEKTQMFCPQFGLLYCTSGKRVALRTYRYVYVCRIKFTWYTYIRY